MQPVGDGRVTCAMKRALLVAIASCGNKATSPDAAVRPWSVRCVPQDSFDADRHPTFEASAVSVRGDLEASKIADTIEAAAPELAACGTDVVTFTVTWFIHPAGDVTAPVGDVKLDHPAAKCATEVIRKLRFPLPRGGGGVLVSWTFAFHSPRATSLAELARAEAAKVQQQLERQLPAITECLERTPKATIAFDRQGTHVAVDIPNAEACATGTIAIGHQDASISCTISVR
jgi:hypothetical protein